MVADLRSDRRVYGFADRLPFPGFWHSETRDLDLASARAICERYGSKRTVFAEAETGKSKLIGLTFRNRQTLEKAGICASGSSHSNSAECVP